ncbi:MAG: DotD/TraH family lipoprotein, partial [Rhodobacteraceae bacterium]|nr:DotD/TraH family lipoprotein [Paracoccaceae bacterium]
AQDDHRTIFPVDAELDAAMKRAAAAAARVAGIEIAAATATPEAGPTPPANRIPPELRRRVSVDWTGPLSPLVWAMAEQIGYEFHQSGPKRPPVMITINSLDTPIWEILRDAGIAATTRAVIIVDAPAQRIELRRPPADQ